MTSDQLRQLFEMHATQFATMAASRDRGSQHGNAQAKTRVAIFTRLAATAHTVPPGRLSELAELKRIEPARFASMLGEIGISFRPRHALECVAGIVNRLQSQSSNSQLYAPRAYREILRR